MACSNSRRPPVEGANGAPAGSRRTRVGTIRRLAARAEGARASARTSAARTSACKANSSVALAPTREIGQHEVLTVGDGDAQKAAATLDPVVPIDEPPIEVVAVETPSRPTQAADSGVLSKLALAQSSPDAPPPPESEVGMGVLFSRSVRPNSASKRNPLELTELRSVDAAEVTPRAQDPTSQRQTPLPVVYRPRVAYPNITIQGTPPASDYVLSPRLTNMLADMTRGQSRAATPRIPAAPAAPAPDFIAGSSPASMAAPPAPAPVPPAPVPALPVTGERSLEHRPSNAVVPFTTVPAAPVQRNCSNHRSHPAAIAEATTAPVQRNWAMAKVGATELVEKAASAREVAVAKTAKAAAARAAAEQARTRAAEARAAAIARNAQSPSLAAPSPPPSPGEAEVDQATEVVGFYQAAGRLDLRQTRLHRRSPSPPPSPSAEHAPESEAEAGLQLQLGNQAIRQSGNGAGLRLQQSRLPPTAAVELSPPAASPAATTSGILPSALSLNALEMMSGKDLDHDGDVGEVNTKERAAVKIQALQRGKSVRRVTDVKQFVRAARLEPRTNMSNRSSSWSILIDRRRQSHTPVRPCGMRLTSIPAVSLSQQHEERANVAAAPAEEDAEHARLSTLLDRPDNTSAAKQTNSRLNRLNQFLDDSGLAWVDGNGELHISAFTSKSQAIKFRKRADRLFEKVTHTLVEM